MIKLKIEKFRNMIFVQKKEEVVRFLQTYDINTPQNDLGCKFLNFSVTTYNLEKKIGQITTIGARDEDEKEDEKNKTKITSETDQLSEYIFYGSNKERYLYFKESDPKSYGEVIAWTPLHYAVGTEKTDMIRLFLEKGADLTVKDACGRTALDLAEFLQREKAVKIIKQHLDKLSKQKK